MRSTDGLLRGGRAADGARDRSHVALVSAAVGSPLHPQSTLKTAPRPLFRRSAFLIPLTPSNPQSLSEG